ncbi:hypothetical protein SBW85_07085 [Vibrio plantisponsor]|uniref:Uncharacterized protein n=1 Tax=Vibrio plantisponsor TaxID=664643 RepID=A0ABU4IG61_9VIBR|nr:hypothetical protein [Vibrio plantisponsor]MDW6017540.1 hypothetical protein [Vibrio plantisponsor]NNM40375.1 hypothetical protein [Vibrio plantisponsor]
MATDNPKEVGLQELLLEKERFEFELDVVLAEIEEYRELSKRLPAHQHKLLEMSEKSRIYSITIYAKLNTLNNTINMLQESKIS